MIVCMLRIIIKLIMLLLISLNAGMIDLIDGEFLIELN